MDSDYFLQYSLIMAQGRKPHGLSYSNYLFCRNSAVIRRLFCVRFFVTSEGFLLFAFSVFLNNVSIKETSYQVQMCVYYIVKEVF